MAEPEHVAIIMDGNRRWARQKGLSSIKGHQAGVKAARQLLQDIQDSDIKVLTLFAFSSENYKRPPVEVSYLMELFASVLIDELELLQKYRVRLRLIGDRSLLDDKLRGHVEKAERLSTPNSFKTLVLALGYGGRWDIVQAMQSVAKKVESGELKSTDVNEALVESHTALGQFPPVDLCIRTGGEQRLSNFVLWQLAYAELFYTQVLWPDFTIDDFNAVLAEYHKRHRRFGVGAAQ